jgi:hypothetical protein
MKPLERRTPDSNSYNSRTISPLSIIILRQMIIIRWMKIILCIFRCGRGKCVEVRLVKVLKFQLDFDQPQVVIFFGNADVL